MADFCKQCLQADWVGGMSKLFPKGVEFEAWHRKYGDLVGLCEPGQTVRAICEGCGAAVLVDHEGNCLEHDICKDEWSSIKDEYNARTAD